MKRLSARTAIFLAVDVVLLAVCLLHLRYVRQRAEAPFFIVKSDAGFVIEKVTDSSACPGLMVGDELLSWKHFPIIDHKELEFLSDISSPSERIPITYRRGASTLTADITLLSSYTLGYVIVILLVGLVTWSFAVFVLLARRDDLTASVLHWAMISMGVSVMIPWGHAPPGDTWTHIVRALFFPVYANVGATFLFLTVLFPRRQPGSVLRKALLIYPPACALALASAYYHLRALHFLSIADYATFGRFFEAFHILLVVYVAMGVVNFVRSYIRAESSEERRKLKWILWGLSVGPAPFALLTTIPELFLPAGIVDEGYTLFPLVIIPLSFAVSLIKYHIMDIDVVINRTTVYTIAVAVLVTLYVLVVGLVAYVVGYYTVESYAFASVLVALLFEPARVQVQHFVDKRFFRVHYNFRLAQRMFADRIKSLLDVQQLAEFMVQHTDELIPVDRIGFFVLTQPGNRLRALAQKNFDVFEKHGVRFEPEKLKTRLQIPIALAEKMEPGVPHESADGKVFGRWGMALVFPMVSESLEFQGFLVLGQKKSGQRFSSEDVDLLSNFAVEAGLAIDRISLEHKLILKQAEAQRLQELSQLKSDFVSYVSHELRTPLTSIKMFTDLLKSPRRKLDAKSRGYVRIIEGESFRLERMVSTILDSAKIDHGVKRYSFEEGDLREMTTRAIAAMKYQLTQHGFRVKFDRPVNCLHVRADPDAVAQAITNLIANSIKYSGETKYLEISLSQKDTWALCRVRDRGCGISPEAIPHLFERFYRDPAHATEVEGVGLGLPLVKHIMDAHGGEVRVTSKPGKGSEFSLLFPLRKPDHEPPKNYSDR